MTRTAIFGSMNNGIVAVPEGECAAGGRSLLSVIEAPGIAKAFSLEVFYDIADGLEVNPADLISASVFPGHTFRKN